MMTRVIISVVVETCSNAAIPCGGVSGHEVLQNAAAEASQIALAAAPTDEIARAVVKGVIQTSTGLPPENVDVLERYRCDTQDAYVTESTSCPSFYARFIQIEIRDQYVPSWSQITKLGTVDYNVIRMVQVG